MVPELLQGSSQEIEQNLEAIKKKFIVPDPNFSSDQGTALDEYSLKHKILQRVDKVIEVEHKDEEGEVTKENQTIVYKKLLIPYQKTIVRNAGSFLFGKAIQLVNQSTDSNSFDYFKQIWKKLKLDTLNRKVAKKVFIEREAAELYYIYRDELLKENKIKVLLLSKDNTTGMYPYYDNNGDLIVFTRVYIVLDEERKEVEKTDIYTDEVIIRITKLSTGNEILIEPNLYGKVPVIYYPKQTQSEWSDVQTLIDRVEEMVSKNADTNDYFGAPTAVIKGGVETMPEKDEQGKVIELIEEWGEANYLTWEHAPESIKLEYNMLKELIHYHTSTPDLSFDNVKGIGNVTGIALKLMFLGSLHKAMDHQELFGEMLERRVNLLKAMIANVLDTKQKGVAELEIEIVFQDSLPDNIKETIEVLSQATGGNAVMSKKTAINNNPLVSNAEEEIKRMDEESETESKRASSLDSLYR